MMTKSRWLRLLTPGPIYLSLLGGCSAAPGSAPTPTESSSQEQAPVAASPLDASAEDPSRDTPIRICMESVCDSACTLQPGVPGGHCVGSYCQCDAPTCGQLDQYACTTGYCAPGLHITAYGLCGYCGNLGEPCCVLGTEDPADVASCYGGPQCIGKYCEPCGALNQPACPDGQACNDGLVEAVASDGSQVCLTACGSVGQQECVLGGCTQTASVLNTTTYQCTENPACGHSGQGCCNQGSAFQDTGICWDGSTCVYKGFIGFGSWWCGSGSVNCGDDCGDDDGIAPIERGAQKSLSRGSPAAGSPVR
jgi:hypothetical protein